jgi:hypothetical protein
VLEPEKTGQATEQSVQFRWLGLILVFFFENSIKGQKGGLAKKRNLEGSGPNLLWELAGEQRNYGQRS